MSPGSIATARVHGATPASTAAHSSASRVDAGAGCGVGPLCEEAATGGPGCQPACGVASAAQSACGTPSTAEAACSTASAAQSTCGTPTTALRKCAGGGVACTVSAADSPAAGAGAGVAGAGVAGLDQVFGMSVEVPAEVCTASAYRQRHAKP
eukprot:352908-Chlamydomonas_euryale.AAC.5